MLLEGGGYRVLTAGNEKEGVQTLVSNCVLVLPDSTETRYWIWAEAEWHLYEKQRHPNDAVIVLRNGPRR